MDRVLYLAGVAGKEVMLAQARNANNLANANTPGFKEDIAYAQSLQVYGTGHDSRTYTFTKGTGADFSPGPVLTTGRDLDVSINGQGWFAVQGGDGTEAYTRAGDLRLSPAGLLTTGAGDPVIGNNAGPITIPPHDKLEIGADGTISIIPKGQAPNTMAVIDRIKLVKPEVTEMEKGGDGLFRMKEGIDADADGAVRIVSGTLESSNVNVVESMVTMMELSKKYQMQVKVMETANEMSGASQQLLKLQ